MVSDSHGGRILLATGGASIGNAVLRPLLEHGHQATMVHAAADVWQAVSPVPPRLLLLQSQLQTESGIELLRQLRAGEGLTELPVMMLGPDSSIEKVSAFELGADDYIVMPPSARELVLRVRAVLRRTEAPPKAPTDTFQVGPLTIDEARHQVRVHQDVVHLTALEFRLLSYLAANLGQACRRERLLSDVWGMAPGSVDRAVDTTVKRLRKKLDPAGNVIETVRSIGYRLKPTSPTSP